MEIITQCCDFSLDINKTLKKYMLSKTIIRKIVVSNCHAEIKVFLKNGNIENLIAIESNWVQK